MSEENIDRAIAVVHNGEVIDILSLKPEIAYPILEGATFLDVTQSRLDAIAALPVSGWKMTPDGQLVSAEQYQQMFPEG